MTYHYIFSTSFGYAALVYRTHPVTLLRSCLPCQNADDLIRAHPFIDWGQPGSDSAIVSVAEMTAAYFNGGRIAVPWDIMDFGNISEFRETVLKTTSAIPYGEVRTYQEIAAAVGRPKAARAAGSALANNPFPILIPCHRVIRSNGTTGLFGGGTDMKDRLISLEKHHRH